MRFAYLDRIKVEIGGIDIEYQCGNAIAPPVRHGHCIVINAGLMQPFAAKEYGIFIGYMLDDSVLGRGFHQHIMAHYTITGIDIRGAGGRNGIIILTGLSNPEGGAIVPCKPYGIALAYLGGIHIETLRQDYQVEIVGMIAVPIDTIFIMLCRIIPITPHRALVRSKEVRLIVQ